MDSKAKNAPSYQELKRERDALLERVERLETTVAELRERLERYEPALQQQATKVTAMRSLSLKDKVTLFRSMFCGREDVFARRWQSRDGSKAGYQPVCANEWRPQVCDKHKFKCAECPNRQFSPLTDADVYRHLEGRAADCRDVIGLYVINEDNTCHFLCADFDDKNCEHGYRGDVKAFTTVCKEWNIPFSVERSRSGNGAHIWIFFDAPNAAKKARRLGNAILTEAMNRDGCLSFKSYDRFFPNQDMLPDGGFGNLVALPLQGQARKQENSVFVDENFEPFNDQWECLLNVTKVSESQIDDILQRNANVPLLGNLVTSSEAKPWEVPTAPIITPNDLPAHLEMIRANALYIPMSDLSTKVINHLKRMAAFRNPEFFQKQAMRFSTYNVPRIISCSEIVDDYLALPRGCEEAVIGFFSEKGVKFTIADKTYHGSPISVSFNGALRDEQQEAVNILSAHTNGIVHATTAYGKTVAAIGLIAKCQVNTLILVHTKALLDQWRQKLEEFLIINHEQADMPRGRGRRKKWSPIGTLSSAGNSLHGIIDIALMQSCVSDGEAKPFVKDYGMVIVDECHHVSAVNFERVLKEVSASRVYGLTATPIRKDGLQPIIFMQCGTIRYTSGTEQQMKSQTFERLLVPRFTAFRQTTERDASYTQIIASLAEDEYRNCLIVEDVKQVLAEGCTPIVLTNLTAHVTTLAEMLQPHCSNVITLIGAARAKEKRQKMAQLQSVPDNEPLVIVATGKYIGEGFDCPRLDTMFLALPVSWKGIVAQYAGRLHRDHEGKTEVRIYDYIDINIPMCDMMYRRRLKGYAGVGYSLMPQGLFAEDAQDEVADKIYDGQNFVAPYIASLASAEQSIVIAAPKVKLSRRSMIATRLIDLVPRVREITVITRERNTDTDRLQQHDINIVLNSDLTHTCTIIDRRRVWYGNVNPLGYQSLDDNIITFRNPEIATSLIDCVSKSSQQVFR